MIGAACAYAAMMWTSNLVAAIFTPGLALYVLMLLIWRERERHAALTLRRVLTAVIPPAAAFLFGLGLSAAFFIPA